MPNFRAQVVDLSRLPSEAQGVKFFWAARPEGDMQNALVLAECSGVQTFVQVSKKAGGAAGGGASAAAGADGFYVCKIDKVAKHSDLALMQKILLAFAKANCSGIIDAACAQKESQKPAENILTAPEQIAEFAAKHPGAKVYLEIGFGSGRHILARASAEPNALFIGAEIHRPSLLQTSKLASDLANIRLLDADARVLLAALPDGLLSGIWLHFPVPWPDAPSRRVISADFERLCARKLQAGGHFHLRTDEKFYYEAAREFFAAWQCESACNQSAAALSKYEARWQRQGKDVYDLFAFSKAPEAAGKAPEANSEEFRKISAYSEIGYEHADEVLASFSAAALRKGFAQDGQVFAKISRLYRCPAGVLALAHFGSFDAPSSCYILQPSEQPAQGAKPLQFIARRPILSTPNLRALELLKGLLCSSVR